MSPPRKRKSTSSRSLVAEQAASVPVAIEFEQIDHGTHLPAIEQVTAKPSSSRRPKKKYREGKNKREKIIDGDPRWQQDTNMVDAPPQKPKSSSRILRSSCRTLQDDAATKSKRKKSSSKKEEEKPKTSKPSKSSRSLHHDVEEQMQHIDEKSRSKKSSSKRSSSRDKKSKSSRSLKVEDKSKKPSSRRKAKSCRHLDTKREEEETQKPKKKSSSSSRSLKIVDEKPSSSKKKKTKSSSSSLSKPKSKTSSSSRTLVVGDSKQKKSSSSKSKKSKSCRSLKVVDVESTTSTKRKKSNKSSSRSLLKQESTKQVDETLQFVSVWNNVHEGTKLYNRSTQDRPQPKTTTIPRVTAHSQRGGDLERIEDDVSPAAASTPGLALLNHIGASYRDLFSSKSKKRQAHDPSSTKTSAAAAAVKDQAFPTNHNDDSFTATAKQRFQSLSLRHLRLFEQSPKPRGATSVPVC